MGDMFPTTLAALGVQIPGDRLGLGTNLYSGSDTLLEIYGYDELYSGLSSKSELMDNLTAGITTPTCDIEVLDYDKNTNTIQLIVSNISGVGADNIQSVTAKVYEEGNQSNEVSYTAEDRGDGSFIITIYFSDLDYRSGTYNVTITAREAGAVNGNIFTTGATTIYMAVDEENVGEIENTSSLGYTIGDFDYSSGSFEITYGRLDMQDLAGVQFAVWKQDDQSDLQWISAELGPDGIYRASVNVFDYAFDDSSFTIDLYELRTDGTSKMIRRDYYSID